MQDSHIAWTYKSAAHRHIISWIWLHRIFNKLMSNIRWIRRDKHIKARKLWVALGMKFGLLRLVVKRFGKNQTRRFTQIIHKSLIFSQGSPCVNYVVTQRARSVAKAFLFDYFTKEKLKWQWLKIKVYLDLIRTRAQRSNQAKKELVG